MDISFFTRCFCGFCAFILTSLMFANRIYPASSFSISDSLPVRSESVDTNVDLREQIFIQEKIAIQSTPMFSNQRILYETQSSDQDKTNVKTLQSTKETLIDQVGENANETNASDTVSTIKFGNHFNGQVRENTNETNASDTVSTLNDDSHFNGHSFIKTNSSEVNDRENKLSSDSDQEVNIEITTEHKALSFVDEIKENIKKNDNTMFEKYSISSLFDALSNPDDFEDEFYWKGKLHKQLFSYHTIKKCFTDEFKYIAQRIISGDNRFISFFYDHYLKFKGLYNRYNNKTDDKKQVDCCCRNSNEKNAEDMINRTNNFLVENDIFIKKFNNIFKLFWEKFFVVAEKHKIIIDMTDDNILKLKNLNKNVTSNYDVEKLMFRSLNTHILGGFSDNWDAKIFFNALNSGGFRKIFKLEDTFETNFINFVNVCQGGISYRETYHEINHQLKLTPYAEKKLNDLSMHLREVLLKFFKKNINNGTENLDTEDCEANLKVKEHIENSERYNLPLSDLIVDSIRQNVIATKKGTIFTIVQDFSARKIAEFNSSDETCFNDVNVYVGLVLDEDVGEKGY
ncbi:hypothetical protein EDEG_02392 [Edhazardia aedis USNM 41457]|uniref:Uncharacterized protein n=1 Tax=Edhazardia aedis (strain USNM 41457) TaxID=1003232 RepID=J9D6S7_EDHAE|nr:hypothetical protein EDEG_02392 [Edhazardia aedis USNM 41457]|eukprot:EJW03224.1 hypothetical protein EDEG_02392 [Edhazardia aedis USNM 41457]